MIELISVHIPKTAGTSFSRILRQHYGEYYLHLYHPDQFANEYLEEVRKHPETRAVLGHFNLYIFRDKYPDAKTVIWMRNPVERIISTYYFMKHDLRPVVHPFHKKFIYENWTLQQLAIYLKDDVSTNFLDKCRDMKDFDFVETVENMQEDFIRFEGWIKTVKSPQYPILSIRKTVRRIRQWQRSEKTFMRIKLQKKNRYPMESYWSSRIF